MTNELVTVGDTVILIINYILNSYQSACVANILICDFLYNKTLKLGLI